MTHPGFDIPPRARGQCRHYGWKGTMIDGGPHCARGVDLGQGSETFMGEPMIAAEKCMPNPRGACALREEWTEAEREAFREAVAASRARTALVMAALPARKPGASGAIDCPACGSGRVSYGWARSNGHVAAQCSTRGCFEIIE